MNRNRFGFIRNYCKSEKSFDLKVYFFLFVITVLGFYNISFFIHPLKWDLIDQAYPYRYFIGETLRNGDFPYWMPFQQSGIPVCADPQGGIWYPIAWIFGFFSGYTIYVISVEFILHIFLAAVGFYLLSKTLGLSEWTALIIAVCYAFSGFIVGNAQHLFYIISAAWIPFALNSYLLLIKHKKIRYAIGTALFLFLLTTGGYPAFWIILFYHIILLFVIYSSYLLIKKRFGEFGTYLKLNFIAAFVYGILTLSFFVSIIYNMDQVGRFGIVSLQDALKLPFSPQCMISFVSPFAVTGNMDFFNTDFSMANAYFGIVAFAFFTLYFFQKKTKISIIILITGVLNLLIAFGAYLPFREFLYHYVPLMDFLRYPSVFRYFVIVSFLLVTGFSIHIFLAEKNKRIFYVFISLIFVFIITIIISRFFGYLNLKNLFLGLAWHFPNEITILQRLVFQLALQCGLLLIFLLIYRFTKIKLHYVILFFVIIDMFVATRLNSGCTVYYEEFKSKDIRAFEKQNFVQGFPIPDKPVTEYSDSSGSYKLFWRNLSMFYKRPAFDGYNPFQIKNCELLKDNYYGFFKEIKKNKLLYFADTAILKFDSITAVTKGRQGMVFIEDDSIKIKTRPLTKKDISITSFSPVRVTATTDCNDTALLVFQQNYNKGWIASVNNKKSKLYRANLTFSAFILPPGKNEIVLHYYPKSIVIARYISLVSLLTILFLLFFIKFHKKKTQKLISE